MAQHLSIRVPWKDNGYTGLICRKPCKRKKQADEWRIKMAQHLSIRVPWKDNGYTGLICRKPCCNNSCLRLKNISESRNDKLEEKLSGQPIKGHELETPCLSEGGCFMSSESYVKTTIHPYKAGNNKTHSHFRETELVYPPFSLPARPFGWTMLQKADKDTIENLAYRFAIDYDAAREPDLPFSTNWVQDAENQRAIFTMLQKADKDTIENLAYRFAIDYDAAREPDLPFSTNWVQDAENQRAIFRTFYENVEAGKSLVIPYAKQVPFIDDTKRVVMGIGRITSITEPPEHNHTDEGKLHSILWETMMGHSIREDRKDGFLMPYWEMMDYAAEHPEFDIQTITVKLHSILWETMMGHSIREDRKDGFLMPYWEMMDYAAEHPEFDIQTITVFAEDDYFDEFSYVTEHVSYDAVVSVLLQIIKALEIIRECIPGNWNECITWTRQRLQ